MYTQTTLQYACEIVPGYGLSRLLLDHEQDSGTINHVNKACFLSHILSRTFWLVTSVVSKQWHHELALARQHIRRLQPKTARCGMLHFLTLPSLSDIVSPLAVLAHAKQAMVASSVCAVQDLEDIETSFATLDTPAVRPTLIARSIAALQAHRDTFEAAIESACWH